jgi:hypothetical protein
MKIFAVKKYAFINKNSHSVKDGGPFLKINLYFSKLALLKINCEVFAI